MNATISEICNLLRTAEWFRRARAYQMADVAAGRAVELLARALAERSGRSPIRRFEAGEEALAPRTGPTGS